MSPDSKNVQNLVSLLEKQTRIERLNHKWARYDKVKDVLIYLAFFGTCIFAPNSVKVFHPLLKNDRLPDWTSFNKFYLKRSLGRLKNNKMVKFQKRNNQTVVEITNKGLQKIGKYAINDITIPSVKKWDKKWRIVIYDISSKKKISSDNIRSLLKKLNFLQLQESVYLSPFPCEKQIEILRQYYDLKNEISIITATEIENETPYREYFGVS